MLSELIICLRKWEISEVAQHKRMQMTKGQPQMLNNGVGTNTIHGLHVICVYHKWCLILPTSFSISAIPVFVSQTSVRGASGMISAWASLPLDWSEPFLFWAEWWHVSVELCNSRPFLLLVTEMVKFSIFMLSGSDCIHVKFEEQFKILNEENVGLPELSLTLSLKRQYWICNFC